MTWVSMVTFQERKTKTNGLMSEKFTFRYPTVGLHHIYIMTENKCGDTYTDAMV